MDPFSINTLSAFLACAGQWSPDVLSSTDCIVLIGSAILHTAKTVFSALTQPDSRAKTLVLSGGIGHSTRLLWEAVARHPRFSTIAAEVRGLPESEVFFLIARRFYNFGTSSSESDVRILVESKSTNCGTNATETFAVLSEAGIRPSTLVVVQDPTMQIRTNATFLKAFSSTSTKIIGYPTFVPRLSLSLPLRFELEDPSVDVSGLWAMPRFLELIVGEILRLRDDKSGYRPNGKGFIPHVDMPEEVEQAWKKIRNEVEERKAVS